METNLKKLFFGIEVVAPWPEEWPAGKIIDSSLRHLTVAFLGKIDFSLAEKVIEKLSSLSLPIGWSGVLDEYLFLPIHSPRTVSYHMRFFHPDEVSLFRNELIQILQESQIQSPDLVRKEFTPHVTVARGNFIPKMWKESFQKLPFVTKNLHLYESLGNSVYKSVWEHTMLPPIEEIPHTADVAFFIRGKNIAQLYQNAMIALSFYFPALIDFFVENFYPSSLDEGITMLNTIIAKADIEMGCPYKAVSFHDEVRKREEGFLEWEMIVDV